jgi:uncharacterized protein
MKTAAMVVLLGCAACTSVYRGPIIDAHAHVRLSDLDGLRPSQPTGTADLRVLDDAAGVTRSALIVMSASGDMVATRRKNDGVIAAAQADSTRFYPVASVHPLDGDSALVELARLAKLGVRQIKLHPTSQELDVADPIVARITERCGALGLAVLFDAYNPLDPGQVGKLLRLSMTQPRTRFVFAHMAFSGFRELLAFGVLRKLEAPRNVWFDLSATAVTLADSPLRAELVWTMRQIGIDRVLFGSDWPVDDPAAAVRAVRRLGLTIDEQRKIFHDNLTKLLDTPVASERP